MTCKALKTGKDLLVHGELDTEGVLQTHPFAACYANQIGFECPKNRLRYQISAQCWRFTGVGL